VKKERGEEREREIYIKTGTLRKYCYMEEGKRREKKKIYVKI
jgi:hypothetical protein